jgi:hypothetical protein
MESRKCATSSQVLDQMPFMIFFWIKYLFVALIGRVFPGGATYEGAIRIICRVERWASRPN